MASIFTYDPDPPRVSSPWLNCEEGTRKGTPISKPELKGRVSSGLSEPGVSSRALIGSTPPVGLLSDYNITKLAPEPQTGPAEYKLHLLLRPRRKYNYFSTGTQTAAPAQSRVHEAAATSLTSISRQNRLTQLTTQLLWRLQQSSPYHASATADLILPQLPEAAPILDAPPRPAKLLAGLESSRGAIYEIGVSDNGDLVGLVEDEMEESLLNLRAMAASLGCVVEVTRMLEVGDCEWHQQGTSVDNLSNEVKNLAVSDDTSNRQNTGQIRQAKLYVAEALVTPDLRSARRGTSEDVQVAQNEVAGSTSLEPSTRTVLPETSGTEQLRITLTGPTTSGKSSLLGTLSTATLDNGRGKSRLSLLKHRHELVSGITSSVAQELLGYRFSVTPVAPAKIVNYATGNVTTWTVQNSPFPTQTHPF